MEIFGDACKSGTSEKYQSMNVGEPKSLTRIAASNSSNDEIARHMFIECTKNS